MNRILIKPHLTEKSVAQASHNKFTFLVSKFARKEEIKELVQKVFNVDVKAVNIVNIRGEHKKNLKTGTYYTKKHTKKAIVELKKGQKIDLFETAGEETK